MSRAYMLNAVETAIAAGRMKADANYVGFADCAMCERLVANHVFVREAWTEGELTVRRLQQLYHRLWPGDILFIASSIAVPLLEVATRYARERGALTVLVEERQQPDYEYQLQRESAFELFDIVLLYGEGTASGGDAESVQRIIFRPDEQATAYAGALALCLMNGQSLEAAEPFCRRAAGFAKLPWYDEVAYS